jgi:glycosyltransferase involved in cell wall biosynthesis
MKVAHFSTEFPPFISGGLGRHVEELLRELSKLIDVDLYLPVNEKIQSCDYNISIFNSVVNLNKKSRISNGYIKNVFFTGFSMALQCYQQNKCYNLIHCHDWLTGIAGLILKYSLNCPLVITCHLPQINSQEAILEQQILNKADLIVAVSDFVKNILLERGLNENKIAVIKNGVNTSFFNKSKLPRNKNMLLFVGRIVPQKGIDIAILSLKYLLNIFDKIELHVIGDGDWLQDAKNLARNCGYPDKIIFHGWKNKQDLIQFYQHAYLFLMPSQYEPFGLTALEALASGTPVVASKTGGLQEFIFNGKNGFLVDQNDPCVFAGRIRQLIEDNELWNIMSENAIDLSNQFSWANASHQLYQRYLDILHNYSINCDKMHSPVDVYKLILREYEQNISDGGKK